MKKNEPKFNDLFTHIFIYRIHVYVTTGKDIIIVVSPEDQKTPSTIKLADDAESEPGISCFFVCVRVLLQYFCINCMSHFFVTDCNRHFN